MVRLRRATDDRGAVTLLTAAMIVPLTLAAALVVDLGMAKDARARAQNAADAAALAAANVLYDDAGDPDFDAAIAAARTFANENFRVSESAWDGCEDASALPFTPDTSGCISFDDEEKPSEVRVQIPVKQVGTAFAGVTGVNEIAVEASAAGALDPGAVIKCSLCVLGSGPHVLWNGDTTVIASSVHFNGSVELGPTGHVTAEDGQITVENEADGANYSPAAEEGSQRIGDPLESLVMPSRSTLPNKTDPCGPGGGTGVYPAKIWPSNATCHLTAGLYVITGAWQLGNNTNFTTAEGVTLYFPPGGMFDAKNANNVTIRSGAPGYEGVAILYDRDNTNDVRVQGNGDTNIFGTIYAPRSTLYANGNSGNGVTNGSIVVDSIEMDGTTTHLRVTDGIDREWRFPPSGGHLTQ